MTGKQKLPKRERYTLRWAKKGEEPGWYLVNPEGRIEYVGTGFATKRTAIQYAADTCNYEWYVMERMCQLVVKNKDGRIAFERTYPDRTPRRKG